MDEIRAHFLPWLRYLWQRFNDDGCLRSSAALTYMSLFALVPLITVMFAILSAIPDLQDRAADLQDLLFDNLFPAGAADGDAISNAKQQVSSAISSFSQQAQNLSGPGVAVLIVTAVLMLRNVEATFNTIWRTHRNRSPIASFLLYWAVLSLGPILIGLALGASTYKAVAERFFDEFLISGAWETLLNAAPLLFSATAFSLLYAAVPNCRVNNKHAIVGGILTAIVFNLARGLFAILMEKTSYTAIYGAFAAFPLLLLWIYVSWIIVLGGGVLVHSLSTYRYEASANMPLLIKALIAIRVLWGYQREGESISEFELLRQANAEQAGLASDSWNRLRNVFLERKLVQIDERGRYLLSRDLDDISYWQLKEWVNSELALEDIQVEGGGRWLSRATNLLRSQRQQQRELLHLSLAELFQE
jgi:membrane protein